jgi:hypothetical protein
MSLKYEDDHNFLNLDWMESWLAPSLRLDVVTPSVSTKDRSLYDLLVIVTSSTSHILW